MVRICCWRSWVVHRSVACYLWRLQLVTAGTCSQVTWRILSGRGGEPGRLVHGRGLLHSVPIYSWTSGEDVGIFVYMRGNGGGRPMAQAPIKLGSLIQCKYHRLAPPMPSRSRRLLAVMGWAPLRELFVGGCNWFPHADRRCGCACCRVAGRQIPIEGHREAC